MYMIMPDDEYEIIRDTIEPEQTTTLGSQRENLLSAMRQSQFPGSKFSAIENIRRFRGF